MESMRGRFSRPVLIGAGIGLVIGLVLGLLIAWVIWPVNVVDTEVKTMRDDLQREYLAMSLQSFDKTGDGITAKQRWDELGPNKSKYLADFLANPPISVSQEKVNEFATLVKAEGGAVVPTAAAGVPTVAGALTATPAKTATKTTGGLTSGPWTIILGIMCLLTIVIGALLAYLLVFRGRKPAIANNRGSSAAPAAPGRVAEPVPAPTGGQEAIVRYLTTYNSGNDLYDDSFSIDSPSGEFLGECGVGISETIGVGDPKKVTAFEVWLFDKNDIQTVTKVLMSQHAFNDPAINQRLSSKGEPVLAEPGKRIVMETATLQLEARVVNMNYGQGALPPSSYFEQLTLELQVWPKA
jgi:hypothetical protein